MSVPLRKRCADVHPASIGGGEVNVTLMNADYGRLLIGESVLRPHERTSEVV